MDLAREMELDLVEISPNAVPPVCRIIDYQKYLYGKRKKPKAEEANAQFVVMHAQNFLSEGAKVKAYVFFRGRSILFSDQGEKLLLRFAVELEDYGKAEQMPKLEGKRMIMMIAPNKKK